MRPASLSLPIHINPQFAVTTCLLVGFLGAIALRVAVGRPDVSHSAIAGLLFASCLLLLAFACGIKITVSRKIVLTGFLGGIFLCVPALYFHAGTFGSHTPDGNYFAWSLIVASVAFAEEVFLRGVLYDKITALSNQKVAIVATAIAFAVLHLPLYGWPAVPLDFAVGLWLGSLRYSSGSVIAPAITHILADLAAWWI